MDKLPCSPDLLPQVVSQGLMRHSTAWSKINGISVITSCQVGKQEWSLKPR